MSSSYARHVDARHVSRYPDPGQKTQPRKKVRGAPFPDRGIVYKMSYHVRVEPPGLCLSLWAEGAAQQPCSKISTFVRDVHRRPNCRGRLHACMRVQYSYLSRASIRVGILPALTGSIVSIAPPAFIGGSNTVSVFWRGICGHPLGS